MTGSRLKLILVSGLGVASVLQLLAWSGVWFTIRLAGQPTPIAVDGTVAAPALGALALAALALTAALLLAGPVFRVILAVLSIVLGVLMSFFAVGALIDPLGVSARLLSSTTGVSGADAIMVLAPEPSTGIWPIVAVVCSVVILVLGAGVLVTGHRWPASSRRYQAVKFDEDASARDSVSEWDSLSEGNDPTAP